VSPAKTAEPIEMPLANRLKSRVDGPHLANTIECSVLADVVGCRYHYSSHLFRIIIIVLLFTRPVQNCYMGCVCVAVRNVGVL